MVDANSAYQRSVSHWNDCQIALEDLGVESNFDVFVCDAAWFREQFLTGPLERCNQSCLLEANFSRFSGIL